MESEDGLLTAGSPHTFPIGLTVQGLTAHGLTGSVGFCWCTSPHHFAGCTCWAISLIPSASVSPSVEIERCSLCRRAVDLSVQIM